MTTALNTTTWYFNTAATETITYSSGSTGKPSATSIVIIDTTAPLKWVKGQSKIEMALDTDMPAQNIV